MSRIGVQPIEIPNDVTVSVEKGGEFGHQTVKVQGPKGELSQTLRPGVNVKVEEKQLLLERMSDTKQIKSYHGLYRSLISNMVEGVVNGFSKELEIIGIGYRAEAQGDTVLFSVGYSHKIPYTAPQGITVTVEDQTKIKVEGIDKQLVGEVAAKIRAFRKPEPYKGKGIKYADEVIKKKSAKSAAAA